MNLLSLFQNVTHKKFTAEAAYAAVDRGIAWLDEKCPNWFNEIDLDRLQMRDSFDCILGQTVNCLAPELLEVSPDVAGFWLVLDKYNSGHASFSVNDDNWAESLGFDVTISRTSKELSTTFEMLQIAWTERIKERRAQQTVDQTTTNK